MGLRPAKDDGAPAKDRCPSTHRSARSFLFICTPPTPSPPAFSVRQSRPRARAAFLEMRVGRGVRGTAGLRPPKPPSTPPPPRFGVPGSRPGRASPPHLRAGPSSAGPAHVAGSPERADGRSPHNGGRSTARAPPPPRAPHAPGGAGRFQNWPARLGEGREGEESAGPRAHRAAGGPHTLLGYCTQSSRPPPGISGSPL